MEQVFPERLVAAAMRDLRAGTREGGAQGSPVVALVNAILGAPAARYCGDGSVGGGTGF